MAIQSGWVEGGNRLVWVGPILRREGWDVKVDEHAKAQVHKLLLQLVQRLFCKGLSAAGQ